jgi:hypothetical protein
MLKVIKECFMKFQGMVNFYFNKEIFGFIVNLVQKLNVVFKNHIKQFCFHYQIKHLNKIIELQKNSPRALLHVFYGLSNQSIELHPIIIFEIIPRN